MLHHISFSRRFYPKRLTISAFNQEYTLRTTRIQKVKFLQDDHNVLNDDIMLN